MKRKYIVISMALLSDVSTSDSDRRGQYPLANLLGYVSFCGFLSGLVFGLSVAWCPRTDVRGFEVY